MINGFNSVNLSSPYSINQKRQDRMSFQISTKNQIKIAKAKEATTELTEDITVKVLEVGRKAEPKVKNLLDNTKKSFNVGKTKLNAFLKKCDKKAQENIKKS